MEAQTFDAWCIIELFGHNKLAGRCTEQNVAGANFLRVEVPPTSLHPAYSRLLNHAAIYAINPVTEDTARAYADKIQASPINVYDLREHVKLVQQQLSEKTASSAHDVSQQDDDFDPDDDDRD